MKKVLWIFIIALILCGGFLAYKKYVDKDESNANQEENISTNANKTKENKTNNNEINNEKETKKSKEENKTQNELDEESKNTVDEQNIENKDKNNETDKSQESNSNTNKTTEIKIKETIAPSGFMGSSLLRVVLYDNGEVYLIRYNGEGYNEGNIESKELLAINASEIKSKGSGEDFEAIVIKGSSNFKVKNKNYNWIEFEK